MCMRVGLSDGFIHTPIGSVGRNVATVTQPAPASLPQPRVHWRKQHRLFITSLIACLADLMWPLSFEGSVCACLVLGGSVCCELNSLAATGGRGLALDLPHPQLALHLETFLSLM